MQQYLLESTLADDGSAAVNSSDTDGTIGDRTPSPTWGAIYLPPTPRPTYWYAYQFSATPTSSPSSAPTLSPTSSPTESCSTVNHPQGLPFLPQPIPQCTAGPVSDPCAGMTLPQWGKMSTYCPLILPETAGALPGWGLGYDVAPFEHYIKCTAVVNTKYATCKDFCLSRGRVCVMAADNDQTKSRCTLAGPHSSHMVHNQTTAENGCLQCWKSQICQCGAPPLCAA